MPGQTFDLTDERCDVGMHIGDHVEGLSEERFDPVRPATRG